MTLIKTTLAGTAFAAAIVAGSSLATPATAAEIGFLGCHSDGSTGFVIGSSEELVCEFTPAGGGQPEIYNAELNTFGLDVGVTGRTIMQWAVVQAGEEAYEPYNLAGTYVGASAEASALVGGGANVLVGGGNEGFTLQPVSIQEQEGINAAIGVSRFTLEPAAAAAPTVIKRTTIIEK